MPDPKRPVTATEPDPEATKPDSGAKVLEHDACREHPDAIETGASNESTDATEPNSPHEPLDTANPSDVQAAAPRSDSTARPFDVPAFALGFPDDPALWELVEAFERGNYALVRQRAPQLARSTDNPLVAAAGADLRRRLDPDPLAMRMLLGAAVLLVVLTAWAYYGSR